MKGGEKMFICELDCAWGIVHSCYETIDDSQKFRFLAKSIKESHRKATEKLQQLARDLLRCKKEGYETESKHFVGTTLSIRREGEKKMLFFFFLNKTIHGLRKILRVGYEICWIDSRLVFDVRYKENRNRNFVAMVLNLYPTYLKRYKRNWEN